MSSNNQVKVVVDKDTVSKFASCQSATLNHLNKYPPLEKTLNYLLSFTLFSKSLSVVLTLLYRIKEATIDSPKSPSFLKVGYERIVSVIRKFDELFNLLVLREGLDEFLDQLKNHNNKPGFWVVLYLVDYVANVSNLVLKEFVAKPLNLAKPTKEGEINGTVESLKEDGLPHIKELAGTTKSLGQGIQSKLQSDYFEPTKNKLQQEYIEPTKGKINGTKEYVTEKYGEFIKPKYDAAYQTVSEKYEGNFTKSESVPRAIVSTGVDLGNLTLEKIKVGVAKAEPKAKSVVNDVAKDVSKTATSIAQDVDNLTK
ncbi:LAFE_0G05996g1_1 [Lachancea fermentati]|uniref:LAFE_0G05996g1_1 n=1 Tax=Lachancea fermentati TaxID=4955 RepID=A0A1G4MHG6_LACFM|nr:LAFE_0G05996g1_1 [Lachancea fermentati]